MPPFRSSDHTYSDLANKAFLSTYSEDLTSIKKEDAHKIVKDAIESIIDNTIKTVSDQLNVVAPLSVIEDTKHTIYMNKIPTNNWGHFIKIVNAIFLTKLRTHNLISK